MSDDSETTSTKAVVSVPRACLRFVVLSALSAVALGFYMGMVLGILPLAWMATGVTS